MKHPQSDHRWPEGAIVYQIYPRSFMDSNGDGIGDIPGITSKLDYLQELGVNALWLSPFYPSPQADFGYDVADYCDVDPQYGTLEDFKRLVKEASARDIRIIVDLVPNHSSSEHPWFLESRSGRDKPKSEWYIWKDALTADGERRPPNNWLSVFDGESAWEWSEERGQYYLHSFDKTQPDLNWSNPEVRDAIKQVMRFWLDLGVSGFRVDAVYWMGKDPLFNDDPINPDYDEVVHDKARRVVHANSRGWPMVYSYLSEMAKVLKEPAYEKNQPFMVTEAYPDHHNPLVSYMSFYVGMDPEVAAPFNFEGLSLPWEAAPWRKFLGSFHHAIDQFSPHCVASYAFGNHDQPRLRSRLGTEAARSCALMSLTLPGMIFIYNGEEIGMRNVEVPPEKVQDPAAIGAVGRDPFRTPMQWNASDSAGFTSADEAWLPFDEDYATLNVATESSDPGSFLNLYKQLTRLRNGSTTLQDGHLEVIDIGQPNVVCYIRHNSDLSDSYATLINFADHHISVALPQSLSIREQLVGSLGNEGDPSATTGGGIELAAYEGRLYAADYRPDPTL